MSTGQIYAPAMAHSEEDVDKFYEDLEKAMKHCKSQFITSTTGDLVKFVIVELMAQ